MTKQFLMELNNREQALRFYEYINQQHTNIKFTKEENNNFKLAFLDVLVENSEKLVTTVYHKSTFTGLMTNFRSFVPQGYKINLIKTLLDRLYVIAFPRWLYTVILKSTWMSNIQNLIPRNGIL